MATAATPLIPVHCGIEYALSRFVPPRRHAPQRNIGILVIRRLGNEDFPEGEENDVHASR
jgi:hypothetical protein